MEDTKTNRGTGVRTHVRPKATGDSGLQEGSPASFEVWVRFGLTVGCQGTLGVWQEIGAQAEVRESMAVIWSC